MDIRISKAADRALRRSDKRDLIRRKIVQLAADPASLAANLTKLRGRTGSRSRVQDWRVVFHVEGECLHIDDVGPRGGVYEDDV